MLAVVFVINSTIVCVRARCEAEAVCGCMLTSSLVLVTSARGPSIKRCLKQGGCSKCVQAHSQVP